MEALDRTSLEKRPGIFIIGSSNVGKRTLIARLLPVEFEDAYDTSSELLVNGWTINTKYYSADVSLWMTHLHEGFSIKTLPVFDRLVALVMVFDVTDPATLDALKSWVSRTDIQKFEILLCIGNKVDLLPGHPVHTEYRRRLLNHGVSSDNNYTDFTEYGISEAEGSSLLGDGEPSWETSKSCLEWCIEHNIEYIEACASNTDFDKCLSVNGDSQGIERLYGALSAFMWPGMVLKSGDKITEPSLPEKEELSEEESDYEFEYEVLSAGSADPWEVTDEEWVSAKEINSVLDAEGSITRTDLVTRRNPDTGGSFVQNISHTEPDQEIVTGSDNAPQPSTSWVEFGDEADNGLMQSAEEPDKGTPFDFEDLEQLMSEIGNMRDNLRLMPDFQRREMAANLAMKMASMFGDGSDNEEGFD